MIMAHLTSSVRPASEQNTLAAGAQRIQRGGAQVKAAQAFARLMDDQGARDASPVASRISAVIESAGKNSAGEAGVKKTTVARLPGGTGTLSMRGAVLAGRSPGDLARTRAFGKASSDLQKTRLLDSLSQGISGGNSALDAARNLSGARQLRNIAASAGLQNQVGLPLQSGDFIHTGSAVNRVKSVQRRQAVKKAPSGLGKLSARFESGGDGISAIGYDRTGGTSYGKYQIASRVGSMSSFLSFLDKEAPDLSRRLRGAGPANTGSRRGAMPDEWKAIAREQPKRFEQLQESFIRESHYEPAVAAITRCTGLDESRLSPAMREVIWSTAVQHGPAGAARIFDRADEMSGRRTDAGYERKLISNVYSVRSGQFGSSSSDVQAAVRNRFKQEKALALNMLEGTARANRA